MEEKLVLKISRIISSESNSYHTIKEINFAISELKQLLSLEQIREKQTKNRIEEKSELNGISIDSLNNYLSEIQTNISNLNFFLELLDDKKRIKKIKSKINILKREAISL